jgi:hypothetical protein
MSAELTGDALVELLGLGVDDASVQASLSRLARGMQPELDPDDDEVLIDWVTVNEIGLEYGFQDEAYVRAWEPELRRTGRLLLSQIYFYSDTPKTQPFPYQLPFGLKFGDDRARVRQKLVAHENTRRSYKRDAWRLPKFDMTVAYERETGLLESIYCHIPLTSWPPNPGEAELVAAFGPEAFIDLFGLRWSNTELRAHLARLGYEHALPQVRSEHMADFRITHGAELVFVPSGKIPGVDHQYPRSLAFAAVNFYPSRELDAREWIGPLPCGLAFSDSQADLLTKVGEEPASREDGDRTGVAVWQFARFTLSVVYSNIENRVLRVTMWVARYLNESSEGENS